MFKPIPKLFLLLILTLSSQPLLCQDYYEFSQAYFHDTDQSHVDYLKETFQKNNKEQLLLNFQNLFKEIENDDKIFEQQLLEYDNNFRVTNPLPDNEYVCKQYRYYDSELVSLQKNISTRKTLVKLAKTTYNLCSSNCEKARQDYNNQLSNLNDVIDEYNQKKENYDFYKESCSKLYDPYNQKVNNYQLKRNELLSEYNISKRKKITQIEAYNSEIRELILDTPMPYTAYNDKGSPTKQGLINLRTNTFVGITKFFNKNGKVIAEGELLEDKRIGEWKFYDEFGNLTELHNYIDGKVNGQYIEYFEQSSQAYIIANLKDDVLHGNYKIYYSNGNLKEEFEMVNGLKNGHFTEYYETGVKKAEVDFENGKVVGSWINYNEQGIDEQALLVEEMNEYLKQKSELTKEYIESIDNSSVIDTIASLPIRTINKENLELEIDFSKASKETINFFLVRPNHEKSIELREKYINDFFLTDGGKISSKYFDNNGMVEMEVIYNDQTVLINRYKENGEYTQTEYQNRNKIGVIKEFDKNGNRIKGDETSADINNFISEKDFKVQAAFSRPSTIEIKDGIWKITWENFSSDDYVKAYEALEEGKEQYTSSTYSYKILNDKQIELRFIESDDRSNEHTTGDTFMVDLLYVNIKNNFYKLTITNKTNNESIIHTYYF